MKIFIGMTVAGGGGWMSALVGTDPGRQLVIVLTAIIVLAFYSYFKKRPSEPPAGTLHLIERNLFEILMACIIIPGFVNLLAGAAEIVSKAAGGS